MVFIQAKVHSAANSVYLYINIYTHDSRGYATCVKIGKVLHADNVG
jgi:hypothetical protein